MVKKFLFPLERRVLNIQESKARMPMRIRKVHRNWLFFFLQRNANRICIAVGPKSFVQRTYFFLRPVRLRFLPSSVAKLSCPSVYDDIGIIRNTESLSSSLYYTIRSLHAWKKSSFHFFISCRLCPFLGFYMHVFADWKVAPTSICRVESNRENNSVTTSWMTEQLLLYSYWELDILQFCIFQMCFNIGCCILEGIWNLPIPSSNGAGQLKPIALPRSFSCPYI